ncbi:MAG: VWA domain-containing protein [Desulfovibrionaceae bacterium]
MTFSRPEYLWLLTLVASAALGCLLAGRRRRHVRGLYPGHTPWRGLARTTFFLGGLFLVALSAAGPQWGQTPAVPTTGPARLVIVLDCSKSMLARDMAPDRLTAAKALVRAVLARLPKLRVGLVTFAGQTRLACPVTADRAGLLAFLDDASPQRMPRGGTNLAGALEAGRLALLGNEPGVILLLSDGEATLESPDTDQTGHGPPVCTVAVGGALPTTVPAADGGLLRDTAGQPVKVGVDVSALADLAQRHGGQSFRLAPDTPAPDAAIAAALGARLPTAANQNGSQRPVDRTEFCLTLALVLLTSHLLLTPIGRLAGLAMLLLPVWDAPALAAMTARALVEQGLAAFATGRYAQAREYFLAARARAPDAPAILYDLGTAAYRLGDAAKAARYFARAAQAASEPLRTKALYNQGNAVFRQGDFAQAVRLYQAVLAATPGDDAAKANLILARSRLQTDRQALEPPAQTPDTAATPGVATPSRETGQSATQSSGQASQGQDDPSHPTQEAQVPTGPHATGPGDRLERKAGTVPLAAREGMAGGLTRTTPGATELEQLFSQVPDLPGLPVVDPGYTRPKVEKDW